MPSLIARLERLLLSAPADIASITIQVDADTGEWGVNVALKSFCRVPYYTGPTLAAALQAALEEHGA
jgi:hypothetical protein